MAGVVCLHFRVAVKAERDAVAPRVVAAVLGLSDVMQFDLGATKLVAETA